MCPSDYHTLWYCDAPLGAATNREFAEEKEAGERNDSSWIGGKMSQTLRNTERSPDLGVGVGLSKVDASGKTDTTGDLLEARETWIHESREFRGTPSVSSGGQLWLKQHRSQQYEQWRDRGHPEDRYVSRRVWRLSDILCQCLWKQHYYSRSVIRSMGVSGQNRPWPVLLPLHSARCRLTGGN